MGILFAGNAKAAQLISDCQAPRSTSTRQARFFARLHRLVRKPQTKLPRLLGHVWRMKTRPSLVA
jgi:hypothetical protein